jgi:branched-chain amino acid transport system substrate-binding protein
MEKVGYYWTEPAFEVNPLTKKFKERFKAKEGRDYIIYTDVAYDCAWLAVLSILAAEKYDGDAIAKAIPVVAARYHGISGWKLLDENGDLKTMDYAIYKIVEGKKKKIGVYSGLTETITITE